MGSLWRRWWGICPMLLSHLVVAVRISRCSLIIDALLRSLPLSSRGVLPTCFCNPLLLCLIRRLDDFRAHPNPRWSHLEVFLVTSMKALILNKITIWGSGWIYLFWGIPFKLLQTGNECIYCWITLLMDHSSFYHNSSWCIPVFIVALFAITKI